MHLNEHPWCRFHLEATPSRVVVATVVDHVLTIEEAPERRLDPSNLQSLCKPCHDRIKQREDNARRRARLRENLDEEFR
jgi:5-methylcytosine-specific restriction protein A